MQCFLLKTGRILSAIASKCTIRANFHLGAGKKVTLFVRESNRSRFIDSMRPHDLIVESFYESTSSWRDIGTRRCPDLMPVFGVFTPEVSVHVTSRTLRTSVMSRAVNFCDRDCIGNIAIVSDLRAVPFRIPMFFWAMTRSDMPNACSHDLGVLRELKYNLGHTRLT